MNGRNNRDFTILLVEDNEGDARLEMEFLNEGCSQPDIYLATDGEEALAFLMRRGRFDNSPRPTLIILDIKLPRKSGHEVLKEVKSDPSLKTIPVIILSSSDGRDDIKMAYEMYASGYVTKPKDIDGWERAVQQIEQYWCNLVCLPDHGCPRQGTT